MITNMLHRPVPEKVNVLSVDVFDSLLLRNAKPEIVRFSEVASEQSRLLALRGHNVAMKDLLHARLLCARVGYQTAVVNCGERDARLIDIFRLIIATMQLSEWVTESELLHIELEYEKRSLTLNRQLLEFLQTQRNSRKVVLTSDTYFCSDELAGLVVSFAGNCFDRVYASCDYSLTKNGGGLFRLLCEMEGCAPVEILHLGDNEHSDVVKPRGMGIHAWHLPRSKPLRMRRAINKLLALYRFRQESI